MAVFVVEGAYSVARSFPTSSVSLSTSPQPSSLALSYLPSSLSRTLFCADAVDVLDQPLYTSRQRWMQYGDEKKVKSSCSKFSVAPMLFMIPPHLRL
jgi:hypothetical protein